MTAYQRLPSASFRSALDPMVETHEGRFGTPQRETAAYDLAWINDRGSAIWDTRRLPDTPEIEGVVSCLARGAMLQSPRGPIAVEDLIPGDRVMTAGGGSTQIDWIGARSYPSISDRRPLFYRVAARAFGGQGPKADTLLGAHAQILIDSDRCKPLVGARQAFAPLAAFEDGMNVVAVQPPGEVAVYGIACSGQEAVLVSGMAVETYHPARTITNSLTRVVLSDMARLFPHLTHGAGFGAPRIPYLSLSEAQGLSMYGL
ncbi:hypothetical protein JANAI62_15610 [Jannaschia pagri]|uniref:Hedgehog/Intein (Hint) domain-containing protein n=1 Tax=Jannaschia pagri TaxID=2829797 RepID=A0ABQ4NKJ6_9RHOB|nr:MULTISPECIES: Hint domain-containing protein [unclassified Jannaschia]GIT91106.1 hypothetical protein JANAI61_15640 [Jannaschia sp. AI_61]GIT94938.1 hypothetical protein JANAI62_15610 [Jannaschia sp. AI_62]